jgi:deoxyribose-phosphate aldolase
MHIEYSYFDISSNDNETKENVTQALKLGVKYISVLPHCIKNIRPECDAAHAKVASPVDYPLGVLDLKSRVYAVEYAFKNGADIVDLVAPSYYLCHRKYDKFREDIRSTTNLAIENNKKIRYFLEYRTYSYDLLYKMAQILLEFGISECFPSTGYLLDDINDNMIAAAMINKKTEKINIIINGNIWNQKQAETICKSSVYGIRVNSVNAVSLLKEKYKNITE